jgi:hypothetical protein
MSRWNSGGLGPRRRGNPTLRSSVTPNSQGWIAAGLFAGSGPSRLHSLTLCHCEERFMRRSNLLHSSVWCIELDVGGSPLLALQRSHSAFRPSTHRPAQPGGVVPPERHTAGTTPAVQSPVFFPGGVLREAMTNGRGRSPCLCWPDLFPVSGGKGSRPLAGKLVLSM